MNVTREHADDYARVVVTLSDTFRIITCRKEIQWILQRRVGGRWRPLKFIRCKESLLRRVDALGIELENEVRATFEALPEIHPWATPADECPRKSTETMAGVRRDVVEVLCLPHDIAAAPATVLAA